MRAVLALFALVSLPAYGGGLAVVTTHLTDDGDQDGFADTNETVELRLTVENTTGAALAGVALHLTTAEPQKVCIAAGSIAIGDLAPGETLLTAPFVFAVYPGIDRTSLGLGPLDDLSVRFDLTVDASPAPPLVIPARLALDLDLDVTGGGGPQSFVESFEGSLGAFAIQNLDDGKHSYEASDGYRCQYSDPGNPQGACDPQVCHTCWLGASVSQAAAEHWRISGPGFSPDGGRAFSGTHSLYFGVDLGSALGWTTPLGTLEAAATSAPIYLAADAVPVLSFKHQVSFLDVVGPLESLDRSVVMVQVADDQDEAVGPWIKLDGHRNAYDRQIDAEWWPYLCRFDPVDDGSRESDLFAGEQWLGPSSTCTPERSFVRIGETSEGFAPGNIGSADGPGLAGQSGLGTWIESSFDLSRFRGRRIRLRLLASTAGLDNGGYETWQDVFAASSTIPDNPRPDDDGWWVDDVTVSGAVTTPAIVASDTKDNSALPGAAGADTDGDALHDICDNCVLAFNFDQTDQDDDSIGDACDLCALDPNPPDDIDCDGVGDAADNCPTAYNADQRPVLRLSTGDEDVRLFALAPENPGVLFNETLLDPLGGMPDDYVPEGFRIVYEYVLDAPHVPYRFTPDGSRVVYIAAPDDPNEAGLYTRPVAGGASTKLNGPLGSSYVSCLAEPVCTAFEISQDSKRVVYRSLLDGPLYSVPITGGSPRLLAPKCHSGFRISPDGECVVYRWADDLFSVPIDGGSPTQLDGPQDVGNGSDSSLAVAFRISPDSSTVVYIGRAGGDAELYRVPIAGGGAIKLNPTLAGSGFPATADHQFDISPDGSRVVYVIDQEVAEARRLYSVPIGGGASVSLSGSPSTVVDFAITPDSSTVIYLGHQGLTSPRELYRVPIGGGTRTKLITGFGTIGTVRDFLLRPDASVVVYRADQQTAGVVELYAVPASGGAWTKLSAPLPAGANVIDYRISPDGATVAYRAFRDSASDDLFTVPITGGPATQHNGTTPLQIDPQLVADVRKGEFGIEAGFGFTADSSALVFRTEHTSSVPWEFTLYSGLLDPDADGDGALVACDVCPTLADPSQADADGDRAGDACDCAPVDAGSFAAPGEVDGPSVSAGGLLEWYSGAEQAGAGTRYDVMRGDIAELPVGAGAAETCLASGIAPTMAQDLDTPAAGAAAYYLIRAANACADGTYGTDSASNERTSGACP